MRPLLLCAEMSHFALQEDIKEFLTGRNVEWEEVDDLAQVAGDVDVLYQTRIQKERFQVLNFAVCMLKPCRLFGTNA